MELSGTPRRVWAYHKAACAIEDTEQDLGLIHGQMGMKGLASIENARPRLALGVEELLNESFANQRSHRQAGVRGWQPA